MRARAFRLLATLLALGPPGIAAAQGQPGECLRVGSVTVDCDPEQPGTYTVSFVVENGAQFTADRLFLWPQSAELSLEPDSFYLPPLQPGGATDPLKVVVTSPAGPPCLDLSLHDSHTGECCARTSLCPSLPCGGKPTTRRGDANLSGVVDISDPIKILSYLFLDGIPTSCLEAMDGDDNSEIEITDAIFILSFLFLGGRAPPPPGTQTCGPDPTADDLPCESNPSCT